MNKRDFNLLQKCFVADVQGGEFPVYQTKSRHMLTLQEQGLVEFVELRSTAGSMRMTVSGWRLTLKGHRAYCEAC